MPARLIKKPDGSLEIRFSYMMEHQARTAMRNELFVIKTGGNAREFYWRATDNKNEHLICDQIRSRNHRDGFLETGLSVSQHTSYQVFSGYTYIYPVSGEVAGTGSDGEPVLRNVKALAKPAKSPHQKYMRLDAKLNASPITYEDIEKARCVCDFGNTLAEGETVLFTAY